VRELDEFASERIDGVVLVPISSFTVRHEELPRGRPLLMICHAGSRSMSATMFLMQRGWTNVRNVEGGMLAWMRDGLPVRTGPPDPGEGDLRG
jgi:rhodanese-related sulfurtransferase